MTRSLRTRTVLALVGITGPVLAVLLLALYGAVAQRVWDGFDRQTRDLADIALELVEYDLEDGYEMEAAESLAVLMASGPSPAQLRVVSPTGTILSAPLLEGIDVTAAGEAATDITLADGRSARLVVVRGPPFTEGGLEAPEGEITVAAARETSATEATLRSIAAWFFALGLAAITLCSVVAVSVVVRGLRPLAELGRQLDEIRDLEHATRLVAGDLPTELSPIVLEIGALLERLRESMQRERDLTADVAHELRTPLSVLRTSLDVALQREREPADYRDRLVRLREVTAQMSVLVENLLMLARLEADSAPAQAEPVELRALVDAVWSSHAASAAARGLRFDNRLDAGAVVHADLGKLRVVIANLLSNAAAYTETGGWIRATSDLDLGIVLEVRDSGPPIDPSDLPRVFDRFWRADTARAGDGTHCGIGLSLGRRLARCQDLELTVDNDGDQVVASILVSGPQSAR